MNFCKDCKHYDLKKLTEGVFVHKCVRENITSLDPVTGLKIAACGWERLSVGECGVEGKYFEQKEGNLR